MTLFNLWLTLVLFATLKLMKFWKSRIILIKLKSSFYGEIIKPAHACYLGAQIDSKLNSVLS